MTTFPSNDTVIASIGALLEQSQLRDPQSNSRIWEMDSKSPLARAWRSERHRDLKTLSDGLAEGAELSPELLERTRSVRGDILSAAFDRWVDARRENGAITAADALKQDPNFATLIAHQWLKHTPSARQGRFAAMVAAHQSPVHEISQAPARKIGMGS